MFNKRTLTEVEKNVIRGGENFPEPSSYLTNTEVSTWLFFTDTETTTDFTTDENGLNTLPATNNIPRR